MFATAADRDTLLRQLDRFIGMGSVPIALYGAGRVARMLRHDAAAFARVDEHITGIIDDDPAKRGTTCAGLEVISLDDAIRRGGGGVKAVIITAEGAAQDALWARRGPLIQRGVRVLCCPERFAGQTWDDALIDHYDFTQSAANGVEREYKRDYPKKDDRSDPRIVAAIRRFIPSAAKQPTICEIGSGSGRWTAEFIADAGEGGYHCCDYSARLLYEVIEHRFAAHAAKLRLHHDEHAKLAGVPDASVDCVFSIDVFVHLKIDLTHQFLTSIRRVLKPSGVAILQFADWNAAGIDRWKKHDTVHHNGGVGPIHPIHMDWLRASAAAVGLSVEPVEGPGGWTYLAAFRRA